MWIFSFIDEMWVNKYPLLWNISLFEFKTLQKKEKERREKKNLLEKVMIVSASFEIVASVTYSQGGDLLGFTSCVA